MTIFLSDRELYLAYRLNELSPDERHDLEDRILGGDEFSNRMQDAEYDLLDDYRANRLNASLRVRVENAFSLDELRQPSPENSVMRSTRASMHSKSAARFGLAFRLTTIAATLVLIAGTAWMVSARFRSEPVNTAPTARTAPPLPPSGTRPSQPSLSPSQLPGETAILLLAPVVTRGGTTAQIGFGPATRTLLAQWVVPKGLETRTFSLLIEQSGRQVAQVQSSNIQMIDGSNVAEFRLPRKVFSMAPPSARYVFIVCMPGPNPETVAEYPVLVSSGLYQ